MKAINRRDFFKIGGAAFATLAVVGERIARTAPADTSWRFGVMADTQWQTGANSGGQPASCAVAIIDTLNSRFIQHGCKFVIQCGDLVDVETVNSIRTLQTRRDHAIPLYNAGIGFFPLRGNHEASSTAAGELRTLFPQTQGNGANLFGATNFRSPTLNSTGSDPSGQRLKGLSYCFDYNNVRCVLLDQFTRTDNTNYDGTSSNNNNMLDQVDWVGNMLATKSSANHGFVFSHKNLIGQNHKDVLFGAALNSNPVPRDTFLTHLNVNGVRYALGGHDHMHHRSIVRTSDGLTKVGQIICSSNSYKFYTPAAGDDGRENPIAQELFSIGYYIFTVDGPRITVDFYSASNGQDYGTADLITPPSAFTFYLRERFGYSLNGQQFEVGHGKSYAGLTDSYQGTTARILSGKNGNTETDRLSRVLEKTVNTGWSDPNPDISAASKVLSLWGLTDNLSLYDATLTGLLPNQAESQKTDIYALSLSCDLKKASSVQLLSGKLMLAAKDPVSGDWINAVDLNYGGAKSFKFGPWSPQYGLGAYGVDPGSSTVWAVVNHETDFVARLDVPTPVKATKPKV